MFATLTILILLVCLGGAAWAMFVRRDVLHPLALLMPMALYLYAYLPYELITTGALRQAPFTDEQWIQVQLLNLLSIIGLGVGCLLGGRGSPKTSFGTKFANPELSLAKAWQSRDIKTLAAIFISKRNSDRLYRLAVVIGAISVLAFALTIHSAGGLFEAYSVEKGGGYSEYGYLRDAIFWSVPALALLALGAATNGMRAKYLVPAILFSSPLLTHGLLGARRGPTFLIVATLVAAWYLAKRRRPNVLLFIGGGMALGMLLLLIVTFREQFRIGSGLMTSTAETVDEMIEEFDERRMSSLERVLGGNEFVYGANVILTFEDRGDFFWGSRILTILFIRPIPKQVWPTKYEDVGMERYTMNVGLGSADDNLMWSSFGAAPGFVADLFAEFSWGAIVAAMAIGWIYGAGWRAAVSGTGLGLVLYILLVAFSLFLISQTLEAFLYRMTLTAVPVLLGWKLLTRSVPTIIAGPARTAAVLSRTV